MTCSVTSLVLNVLMFFVGYLERTSWSRLKIGWKLLATPQLLLRYLLSISRRNQIHWTTWTNNINQRKHSFGLVVLMIVVIKTTTTTREACNFVVRNDDCDRFLNPFKIRTKPQPVWRIRNQTSWDNGWFLNLGYKEKDVCWKKKTCDTLAWTEFLNKDQGWQEEKQ